MLELGNICKCYLMLPFFYSSILDFFIFVEEGLFVDWWIVVLLLVVLAVLVCWFGWIVVLWGFWFFGEKRLGVILFDCFLILPAGTSNKSEGT